MAANLIARGMRTAGGLEPTLATHETNGGVHIPRSMPMGLKIPDHDAVVFGYDGSDRVNQISYKVGGAAGTNVAVMTLAYDVGGRLASQVLALV